MINRRYCRTVFLLFILLSLLGVVGMAAQDRPLNENQVLALWKLEKDSGRVGHTLREVTAIDFQITDTVKKEMLDSGMSPDLIEQIGKRRIFVMVTVRCRPVDCGVRIDAGRFPEADNRVGDTRGSLSVPVRSGPATILVEAPGYKPQRKPIEVPQGVDPPPVEFDLEPQPGTLSVRCTPDCFLKVNGAAQGDAPQPEWKLALAPREYELTVYGSMDYEPEVRPVQIRPASELKETFVLKATAWAAMTGPEVLDKIVARLGGPEALATTLNYKAEGKISVPNSKFDGQIRELSLSQSTLRWDIENRKGNYQVALKETNLSRKGDKAYNEKPMQELADQLDESLGASLRLRLPVLLDALRSDDLKLSKSRVGEEVLLIAESENEKITVATDSNFRPKRVLSEMKTGSRDVVEIEYGFGKVSGLPEGMPQTTTLRLSSRGKYTQTITLSKIDLKSKPKAGDFELGGGLLDKLKVLPGI